MDWIEEVLTIYKEKMLRKSLKTVLNFYIVLAILVVLLFYGITIQVLKSWEEIGSLRMLVVLRIIKDYCILFYSIVAIFAVTHFFYKNRIKEPIRILKMEAEYIKRGNLSVSCRYESKDEFHEVCEAFEKMRLQMQKKQIQQWDEEQAQSQMLHVFTHDIRTPITIMQGYLDMIVRFFPYKMETDKVLEIIGKIKNQTQRMHRLLEQLRKINDVNQIQVHRKKQNIEVVIQTIEELIESFKVVTPITMRLNNEITKKRANTVNKEMTKRTNEMRISEEAYVDLDLIVEVLENLIKNAISFAQNEVTITLEKKENKLFFYVKDDGHGFSKEDLYYAKNPYYSKRIQEENNGHQGMGLPICELLIKKHQGCLTLSNGMQRGAIVCAVFRMEE